MTKETQGLTHTQKLIWQECNRVRSLLIAKNREYGDSALKPINVFSSLDAIKQLEVRVDDKLKRILNTRKLDSVKIHEDTEQDLIGYLILLRVARKVAKNE